MNVAIQQSLIDSVYARNSLNALKQPTVTNPHQQVLQQYQQYIRQNYGNKEFERVKSGYALMNDTTSVRKYLDSKFRGFYAHKNDFNLPNLMNRGAFDNSFKGASLIVTSNNAAGALNPVQVVAGLEDKLVIGNIPFNFEFTDIAGQYQQGTDVFNKGLKKFSFDKEAYIERMNKYVNQSFDVNKYLLKDINVSTALKSYIGKQIDEAQHELSSLSAGKNLSKIINPEELIYLDSAQIRHLLSDHKVLQQDPVKLATMGKDSAAQEAVAIQRYIDRIYALKSTLDTDLLAKKTLTSQQKINELVTDNINSPVAQRKNIQSLLPLNFIQRLFLQARNFQIGNIGSDGSSLTRDLFMAGFQGSFLSNNKFLSLGAGVRNDAADIKNIGLNSSIDPGNFATQFIQLGTGDPGAAHTHVGILNANSKQSRNGFDMPRLPQNTFVGAVSEQISLGKYGTIAAEVGKSNTTYKNSATGNENMLASKAAAMSMFNDFWETVSVGLDYSGSIKELDMSQRAYISYAGLGYNNPGSPGATRGSVKYGLNVVRKFNKRKVSLGFRADVQDTKTSAIGKSKWNNTQLAVDFRIRLKKNLSFSSRIAQAMMKGVTDSSSITGFVNRNINIGTQWSGRLFSIPNSTNANFSLQQINVFPIHSLLLNMNINHSVVINTHVLSVNVMYNKDVKDQAIYGDLFNAETGWSYVLMKKINCSSGLTYMKNKGVVEQAGIKQSIGTMVSSRLNVNLYLDCRKSIMDSPQNYLFGNFNTQLAVQYQLN
ncbi:hypothetical protein [Chitinophaga sp. HK235]|uniref:hypothetical protein n=1 Tax=Chitinophaga sp. HK235 TaxID=2952571 RepID=UPI001BA62D4E|nr:hypothetical protein [Chitinophaga sp. HK235]